MLNNRRTADALRRALRPAGRFIMVGASAAYLIPAMFQSMVIGRFVGRNGQRMGSMGMAQMRCDDLAWMCAQMVAGTVVPVIDRCYPLADAAAAVRYADEVHARGKVVIVPQA